MGFRVASWSIHVLLVGLLLAFGSESRQITSANIHHHHDAHSASMFASVFIDIKDMKKGTTKPIYLPKEDYSKSHLLPRDEAESIPFSSRHLQQILDVFSAPHGSALARTIEDTIYWCERPPMEGETKLCATSLESMLDFVLGVFGITPSSGDDRGERPTLLTSTFLTDHREAYQNYTILETPKEVRASKMVGCHTRPYPHAVFYCHNLKGGNKVYKMLLGGENGDIVDMYVACHLGTSQWNPNGPAFIELGIAPGAPVCHVFLPHGNFLWIHNEPTAAI